MNIEELEIKININEKGYMLAQAELTIDDLVIRGFRVMKSNEDESLYLSPPSIPNRRGNYTWIVKINDPKKWNELSQKVIETYWKEKKESELETVDIEEAEIKSEDLPF